jgi:hypothetical protein
MTKGQPFDDALVRSKPPDSFRNFAICRDHRVQFVRPAESNLSGLKSNQPDDVHDARKHNQTGSWSTDRRHTTLQMDEQKLYK